MSDAKGSDAPVSPAKPPEAPQNAGLFAKLPYVASYWVVSLVLIFQNAWILRQCHFPVCLTAWHMFVSACSVNILRFVAPGLFGPRPDWNAVKVLMNIGPVALLFAVTLVFSNTAVIHISVAFVQMIKASHPVLCYFLECCVGIDRFFRAKLETVAMVSVGVLLAVTGELNFHVLGFIFQVIGSTAECARLVAFKLILTSNNVKLDPLTALSYYAPLCFLLLLNGAFLFEIPNDNVFGFLEERVSRVGVPCMLANGFFAFSLNVLVVQLIRIVGPTGYTVVGISKDVMSVTGSALLGINAVQLQQFAGYAVAVFGIQMFNAVTRSPDNYKEGIMKGLFVAWQGADSCPPVEPPKSKCSRGAEVELNTVQPTQLPTSDEPPE